jgi:hypothetical protein
MKIKGDSYIISFYFHVLESCNGIWILISLGGRSLTTLIASNQFRVIRVVSDLPPKDIKIQIPLQDSST